MSLDRFNSERDVGKLTTTPERKLPTMYDLPSELPGEEGLPDELHFHQPRLLLETFHSSIYTAQELFIGSDINLYYDPEHTLWCKRPDWFVAVGVPKLREGKETRRSYVVWDEVANPLVAVELLSDSTYKEDLGETTESIEGVAPPTKWRVYEEILKIPYYVTFDMATNELQAFRLVQGVYVPFTPIDKGLWIAEVALWLDLWFGSYYGIERLWLRWRDKDGNWIPTLEEKAEQESHRADQERMQKEAALKLAEQQTERAEKEAQRADLLAAKLRELGINPNEITGKSD